MTKWQELQNDLGEFADKAFPNSTPKSKALHLSEEALEAANDPSDLIEWADCLTLVLDGARKAGFSSDDLYNAAVKKLEINKARKWGDADENGVVRHVKN